MLSGMATADIDAVGAGFSGLNATHQQRNEDRPDISRGRSKSGVTTEPAGAQRDSRPSSSRERSMRAFSGRAAYHEMMEMILGFWVSQTIRTIADWSLADHLATGALTAGEIARREGAAVETTVGLLRAGVGLGLMTVSADGRFHGTERLATLRTDAPGSLRPIALSFIDPEYWQQSLRRRACTSTAWSPSVRPWPWYAVRCRSVHATRLKMWNHVRNYWSRPQVDAGDGCAPDVGGHVRFGDYLQSLADEQNLLRREY
jgi:hypothetical protein